MNKKKTEARVKQSLAEEEISKLINKIHDSQTRSEQEIRDSQALIHLKLDLVSEISGPMNTWAYICVVYNVCIRHLEVGLWSLWYSIFLCLMNANLARICFAGCPPPRRNELPSESCFWAPSHKRRACQTRRDGEFGWFGVRACQTRRDGEFGWFGVILFSWRGCPVYPVKKSPGSNVNQKRKRCFRTRSSSHRKPPWHPRKWVA